MITHGPLVASNLPIQTLVAGQQPTNTHIALTYMYIHWGILGAFIPPPSWPLPSQATGGTQNGTNAQSMYTVVELKRVEGQRKEHHSLVRKESGLSSPSTETVVSQ